MDNSEWLEAILSKSLSENTIRKVLNIETKDAVPEGDNYLSEIKRAIVTVIYNDGFKGKEMFIYKKEYSDVEKLKVLGGCPIFKSEINVYERVLKYFNQLMNEYQDNNDKLWCNMIGYKPYDLIVFEDLKAQNFKTPTRKNLLDLNHGLLVMHGLARFHALGYVLLQKGLASEDEFIKHYLESDLSTIDHTVAGGIKQLANVMLKDWPIEWHETARRVAKQEKIAVKKVQELFKVNEDCFKTICHGDVWTCNLMFKYCPYNDRLPVALKFIDFQNTNVNSYIFDILTFIYSSMQADVRRENFNEILEMYQKTLQSTLAIYGMEDKAPTLEQVLAETKRTEYYSFVTCLISLPLVCADCEKPMIFENLNFDYNVRNAYNVDIFNNIKFIEAVKPDIRYWEEQNIF